MEEEKIEGVINPEHAGTTYVPVDGEAKERIEEVAKLPDNPFTFKAKRSIFSRIGGWFARLWGKITGKGSVEEEEEDYDYVDDETFDDALENDSADTATSDSSDSKDDEEELDAGQPGK